MRDQSSDHDRTERPSNWSRRAELAHRIWLGGGFLYAVGHLFLLRGPDARITVLFLLPPLAACGTLAAPNASRAARAIASLLLLCVGFAVLIGTQPALLPGVRGFRGLPLIQDRILTLYAAVYCFFLVLVIPPCVMVAGIRRETERRTSTAVYWLALMAWIFIALNLIVAGIVWLLT
jgi:hypothetical protein